MIWTLKNALEQNQTFSLWTVGPSAIGFEADNFSSSHRLGAEPKWIQQQKAIPLAIIFVQKLKINLNQSYNNIRVDYDIQY